MNEQQTIAYIQAQTACALIEMAAMQADNDKRKVLGQSMSYGGSDFFGLLTKYPISHNAVLAEFFPQQ